MIKADFLVSLILWWKYYFEMAKIDYLLPLASCFWHFRFCPISNVKLSRNISELVNFSLQNRGNAEGTLSILDIEFSVSIRGSAT